MTRIEGFPGSLKEGVVRQALGDVEKRVLGDFVETLAASYCDGLRGVDYAVLPAGDLADFLNNHRGKPERIDLRIVPDAPSGSTIRECFVDRLEEFVGGYLAEVNLPYTQISGKKWHLVQRFYDEESTDLEHVDSDGSHNLRFEVHEDPVRRCRPIGVVISNVSDRALDDHLKWEKTYRQRSPIILLDSKSIRNRIRF